MQARRRGEDIGEQSGVSAPRGDVAGCGQCSEIDAIGVDHPSCLDGDAPEQLELASKISVGKGWISNRELFE